jgi:AraC family transcriptional regulator of adaptative response/methylated-DNA-[protein]-cysteine methyltransferase
VLKPMLAAILAHLDGDVPRLDLPVDVAATRFQWRCGAAAADPWQGLPPSRGGARTAEAMRAVARACASNRVALVVPCHRVVRADGSPGGYRWGASRKRLLLEKEKGQEA